MRLETIIGHFARYGWLYSLSQSTLKIADLVHFSTIYWVSLLLSLWNVILVKVMSMKRKGEQTTPTLPGLQLICIGSSNGFNSTCSMATLN